MQIGVVSRKSTSTPKSPARVCLDHLLLHFAVEGDGDLLADIVLPQVDQRVLLGELGERRVQPPLVGRAARKHGLQRRRGEVARGRSAAARRRVADPDVVQAPELADPPGASDGLGAAAPRSKTLIAVTLAAVCPVAAPGGRRVHRAGEHAHVGDLLAGPAALDLEHGAARPGRRRRLRGGQQFVTPAIRHSMPAPVIAEPKNTGCTSASPVWAASAARSRR